MPPRAARSSPLTQLPRTRLISHPLTSWSLTGPRRPNPVFASARAYTLHDTLERIPRPTALVVHTAPSNRERSIAPGKRAGSCTTPTDSPNAVLHAATPTRSYRAAFRHLPRPVRDQWTLVKPLVPSGRRASHRRERHRVQPTGAVCILAATFMTPGILPACSTERSDPQVVHAPRLCHGPQPATLWIAAYSGRRRRLRLRGLRVRSPPALPPSDC